MHRWLIFEQKALSASRELTRYMADHDPASLAGQPWYLLDRKAPRISVTQDAALEERLCGDTDNGMENVMESLKM